MKTTLQHQTSRTNGENDTVEKCPKKSIKTKNIVSSKKKQSKPIKVQGKKQTPIDYANNRKQKQTAQENIPKHVV